MGLCQRVGSTLFGAMMALGLLLGARGDARACSCSGKNIVAPANGEVDVPPNTRLWHADPFTTIQQVRFMLTGPQGEVPLRTLALGPPSFALGHVSTPESELVPGASYGFSACGGPGHPCKVLSRFTVGERRAEKPRIPVETGKRSDWYREEERGSSCGSDPSRFVILNFDWEGLLLLVDVAAQNPYPADPAGLLHHARTAQEIQTAGGVWVGRGPCGPFWPRADDGRILDSAEVRFGAVNVAGEFSGWGDPVTIQLPEGCGCRLGGNAPAGGAGVWMAAALGLFWVVRKRR
jgi:MYXO-CTERM domain-containing protein